MFASGVLLYQMLSGALPFAGTDEAIMYKIVYEQHKPLQQVMNDAAFEPFDAVLDRALAKDPARRYSSAMEMRTALMALAPPELADVLPADVVLASRHEGLEVKPAVARQQHDSRGNTVAESRSVTSPLSSSSISPSLLKSRPGSGSSSIPVPTGWDTAELGQIERELAQHVGAVARVLVRRAARG